MRGRVSRALRSVARTFSASIEVKPKPSVPILYNDFSGGFDSRDETEDTPPNSSKDMLNMEVSRKGRLIRAPGTTELESFAGKTVTQLAVHASFDDRSELIVFAPPYVGWRESGATTWQNAGLPLGRPYDWTNYGGTFVFANAEDKVFTREPRTAAVVEQPKIPIAHTYTEFAGRLFAGACIIDGNYEPLGLRWNSTSGAAEDFEGTGSGFELLINAGSYGDRIVAIRAMNLDFVAILCRHNIWIGRRTGVADRPADPQPRVGGVGTVNVLVAHLTPKGIMFLSDDGVRAFDGNQAPVVSAQINANLLPLDYTKIDSYSASYNPINNRYYLYTPTETWIYDIEFGRWYKRSIIVKSGTIFPPQFPGTLWSGLAGQTWAMLAGQRWADLAPQESDLIDMIFLGNNGVLDLISSELYGAVTNYGAAMATPKWTFSRRSGNNLADQFTISNCFYEYAGAGTLRVYAPDHEGNDSLILTQVLQNSAVVKTVNLPFIHTGKGIGLSRIEYAAGSLETAKIEAHAKHRGRRVEVALPDAPVLASDF
jgi:hypothetical protein